MKTLNISELEKSGSVWENHGMKRLYISEEKLNELVGLKIDYYNTGNVSSIYLNGDSISNTKGRKMMITGKFYYDYNTEKFASKSLAGNWNCKELAIIIREKY